MILTCKDVEAILYGYDKHTGDTGKNLVADMLNEVANALGFNIALLKEDQNPNKNFCFQKGDEDIEIIRELMTLSKSKSGKRLRCRDYIGAGISCVTKAINLLKLLAIHAGISKSQVNMELRRMQEFTNQFVLRELIHSETNDYDTDLKEHFFAPVNNCQDEDYMDEVDKQVFLEFLYQNISENPSDIRGIYWFFKQEKEQENLTLLMTEAKKVKELPPKDRNELKDYLSKSLKLEQVLLNDDNYSKQLEEWVNIFEGKGKLQDNLRLKKSQRIYNLSICRIYKRYLKLTLNQILSKTFQINIISLLLMMKRKNIT